MAPAPDKILNRLRLQLKNLGSDQLRLRNTAKSTISAPWAVEMKPKLLITSPVPKIISATESRLLTTE